VTIYSKKSDKLNETIIDTKRELEKVLVKKEMKAFKCVELEEENK
jgi:hypothetical protein